MTNEEATEIIKFIRNNALNFKVDKALEMAIKALEQEPCEDAVSRQAVDTLIDELARAISDELCCMPRGKIIGAIMQDIRDLPPVTPQPKNEDISKAFQLGMAFGFGEKHDETDKVVEEIKASAPQPKMGKWIMHRGYNADGFGIEYSCSECKEREDEKSKYCPNCGAKMQEVEE